MDNMHPRQESESTRPSKLFPVRKIDAIFALCAMLGSIFAAVCGIFSGYSLGYALSVVLLFALYTVYFAKSSKFSLYPALCGLLALLNSGVFVCTTNASVRFFTAIATFLLSLVCLDGLLFGDSKGNRNTLGVFLGAASTIGKVGFAVGSLFSGKNESRKTIGKALIGICCALPVLLVVVPLLISSDHAFHGMVHNIFANTFKTALKTIFGLIVAPFFVSYGFSLKAGRVARLKASKGRGIENVYVISFLCVISACYLLYLFSQLAYFFSAFQGFLPSEGITHAQYARKGFFEMCIIAVINFVLVFSTLLAARKKNGKVCVAIKVLATFISMFTLMIVATAISKMVLYIDAYGMTVLRLTTSAFMVFVSAVFVSLILRIYIRKINVIKVALLAAGCVVLILGTVNVNAVCAKYNYDSYLSGKLDTIDVVALYDLGAEGVPYLVKLASVPEKTVADEARQFLAEAYTDQYFDNMEEFQEFTVADLRANRKNQGFARFSFPQKAAYDSLYAFWEENPGFGTECCELLGVVYSD